MAWPQNVIITVHVELYIFFNVLIKSEQCPEQISR